MFDENEYPKYLRPEVTAELKRRSVQCYPSLAPLFCPENPHAAFAYVDSSRLEHGVCGIEMPLETPLDEFTANVAVLHEITTHCKANLETREIIEIETSDGGVDHGFCVDENVIIEDEEFAVRNLDSVVETENSGELYQLLLNMKKCSMLWYSRSGLNFYAELVKAHIAAYPLRLCDGYCDEVTISIKESDSQFFEYRTDEDEVYSLHRPDDDCGERVSGVLADAVRLFAKEQMQLNPGRWLTPENCWQAPADSKN